MTINEYRSRFPHVSEQIYLNHAATGVLSQPVVDAVDQYIAERHGDNINNYQDVAPRIAGAKDLVARLIGTRGERVEFTPNTSSGLNVLAGGLDWKPGDRVAVPSCEFPANVYPFLNLADRGVVVDLIPHREGTFALEDVEHALRPETRVLTVSWVQFLSGFRADLEGLSGLCREYDVLLCVDAIQGLGALQLDVEASGIDFLACGGHKWLMGTQGVGFLYLTEAVQERIRPAAGWLHGPVDWDHLFDYDLQFHATAERFRLGTPNTVGIMALHAALALHFDAGPAAVEEEVLKRAEELSRGLEALGIKRYGTADQNHASGIVTVSIPRAGELASFLADKAVHAAVRNGKLRFSPHAYNTSHEINTVLSLLERFGAGI